jgi:hypothetical protein
MSVGHSCPKVTMDDRRRIGSTITTRRHALRLDKASSGAGDVMNARFMGDFLLSDLLLHLVAELLLGLANVERDRAGDQ